MIRISEAYQADGFENRIHSIHALLVDLMKVCITNLQEAEGRSRQLSRLLSAVLYPAPAFMRNIYLNLNPTRSRQSQHCHRHTLNTFDHGHV